MGIIAALLSIVLGFVQVVLGLRVVAVFFGLTASGGPALVDTIYRWSSPWVAPFSGWLPNFSLGGFVLDTAAVLAIIVYGVVGGLIIRALRGSRRS